MLGTEEQLSVQAYVADLSPEERRAAVARWHCELSDAGDRFRLRGSIGPQDRVAVDYAIEAIIRAECIETGRGWGYRMKRRVDLFRAYMKP